jgi:hypothetical protein
MSGQTALPGCSTPAQGCPDNRVMLVNKGGSIVWQYGDAGVTGPGFNQLDTPVHSVIFLGFQRRIGPHVMITDQGNQRVIVVDRRHRIVWQYGTTGVGGNGPNQLNDPNSAELLQNGNILIADENNNRAIEVNTDFQIVKQFTAGGTLNGVAFASRLSSGNTLITDSNNNRVVEVDPNDAIVWQYATNTEPGSNPNPLPTRAVRLKNGNTLISDQFNQRVIEVTQAKQIVFQQGQLNNPGNGANQLNGPYDAKKIGDYTGQTRPGSVHGISCGGPVMGRHSVAAGTLRSGVILHQDAVFPAPLNFIHQRIRRANGSGHVGNCGAKRYTADAAGQRQALALKSAPEQLVHFMHQ